MAQGIPQKGLPWAVCALPEVDIFKLLFQATLLAHFAHLRP